MLKLIGALLVLIASVGYTMVLLDRQQARLHMQQSMVHMLGLLAEEIRYERLCLGEIFYKLKERFPGDIGSVMGDVADRLDRLSDVDAGQVFKEVLTDNRRKLMLSDADLDILADAGQTLGYLDRNTQIIPLEQGIRRLQALHDTQEQELQKKKKVFLYLGMSCGIFVVLVLL